MKKIFSIIIAGALLLPMTASAASDHVNVHNNTHNKSGGAGGNGGAGGAGGNVTNSGNSNVGNGAGNFSPSATIQKGAVTNTNMNLNANDLSQKQKQNQKQQQQQGQVQQQAVDNANSNNSQQTVGLNQTYIAAPNRPTFSTPPAPELNTQQAQISNEQAMVNMAETEYKTVNQLHKGKHYVVEAEEDGVRMRMSHYDAMATHRGRIDDTVTLLDFVPANAVSIGVIHAAPSGSAFLIGPDYISSVVGSMVADRFHDVYVCKTGVHYISLELGSKGRGANVNMGNSAVNKASDLAGSIFGNLGGQSGRGMEYPRFEVVYEIVAK